MKQFLILLVAAGALVPTSAPADAPTVATSINAFGLDLHRRLAATGGNLVASPWSIEAALAMTYAGADGKTKEEMAAVLHLPADERVVHRGFAALAADLLALAEKSQAHVAQTKNSGGPVTPLQINVANRLFGQSGYPFEQPFLDLTAQTYGAPVQLMDFINSPDRERQKINAWVEQETRERIRDLIPPKVIDRETRLVLVNAVFLKAAWPEPFAEEPMAPFFVDGTDRIHGPGLVRQDDFRHGAIPGGAAIAMPYADGGLQLVLFVPEDRDGLAAMEKQLTPKVLASAATAAFRPIILHFPPFKLDPGRVLLSKTLGAMGMPTAFDSPQGSADFSRMAPRSPDDYLRIGEVVHQAMISVDKNGTEAAAATAVVMPRVTAAPVEPARPLELRVDRPFAFAIQHVPTGACLFFGRVTDPR